ncbi:MAG: hypothetical protein IT242_02480 [Bacteroidia bacterium]|nr:hypothetical protein [Bacteroidia bacterium]
MIHRTSHKDLLAWMALVFALVLFGVTIAFAAEPEKYTVSETTSFVHPVRPAVDLCMVNVTIPQIPS